MKKYAIKAVALLSVMEMVCGCYDDKGNYSYTFDSMNEIGDLTITPAPSSATEETYSYVVEFPRPMGEESELRTLEVKAAQSLNDDPQNLEYTWYRSYTDAEGQSIRDTVRNDGVLELEFYPNQDSQQINLRLCITDRSTTLSRYYSLTAQTRCVYQNSLFVLHGNTDGEHLMGNIEVHNEQTTVLSDAYGALFEEYPNPFGYATHLAGFLGSGNYNRPWLDIYMWVADSHGYAYLYNPFGLTQTEYNRDILYPNDPNIEPAWVSQPYNVNADARIFMIDKSGRLLISQYSYNPSVAPLMTYFPGSAATDPAHIPASECEFAMAAEDRDNYLLVAWDKRNSRFLYTNTYEYFGYTQNPQEYRSMMQSQNPVLDPHIDYSELSEECVLTGKEILYMHGGQFSNQTGVYAFFRDPATSKVYRYELASASGGGKDDKKSIALSTRGDDGKGDGKDEGDSSPFTITGKCLTGMTGVTEHTPFVYWTYGIPAYIFYAVEGTLYRYDTFTDQAVAYYTAPAGWTVTKLKFKGQYTDQSRMDEDSWRQLCIGLEKGDAGAVAVVQLKSNGDMDESFEPQFYEGFGHIIDLYYAYAFPR